MKTKQRKTYNFQSHRKLANRIYGMVDDLEHKAKKTEDDKLAIRTLNEEAMAHDRACMITDVCIMIR